MELVNSAINSIETTTCENSVKENVPPESGSALENIEKIDETLLENDNSDENKEGDLNLEENNLKENEEGKNQSEKNYDSDDENDDVPRIIKKKFNLIESDSESDSNEITTAPIYTTDSKGNAVLETDTNVQDKLSNLCDFETSEDESETSENETHTNNEACKKLKSHSKLSTSSHRMSSKEAARLRREIKSESQRMLRESNVYLPYHKPKTFTIKEFLSKRSKFASVLPDAKISLKMPKEVLEVVSKKLEERKKEVGAFYKSDSEGEGDGEKQDSKEEENVEPTKDETHGQNENNEELNEGKDAELEQNQDGNQEKNGENGEENMDNVHENDVAPNNNQSQSKPEENDMEDAFNVKDLEETPKRPFRYGDLDKEIENYDPNDVEEENLSTVEKLKKALGNSVPKLKENPGDVIELEIDSSRPSEVTRLVERFIKHTEKKSIHKNKVQLNITRVQSGEIIEETVAMNVEEDETATIEEKPGVRLRKLKNELENQMAQMKAEIWQKKTLEEEKENENEEDEKEGYEKGNGEDEKDILDDEDEEEEEITDEEEEEDQEKDVHEEERKKSVFFDDEAEESDIENNDEEIETNVSDEDETNEENTIIEVPKRKLTRIVKGFTEDDSDDEKEVQNIEKPFKTPLKRQKQPQSTEFLTPISYITGLQNLNESVSKNLKDSPVSKFLIPNVPSPLKDNNWQSSLQKKLFNDTEITNSQMQSMREMCTENLTESQIEQDNQPIKPIVEPTQVNTQDLLEVCSGDFDLTVKENDENSLNKENTQISNVEIVKISNNEKDEVKNLNFDEENLISQLLDEEELENFKKKISSEDQREEEERDVEEEEDHARGGVIDSDDEDVRIKRNKKQLHFSDEDSSDEEDEENEDEEEINLHDEEIAYDSEENEIIEDKPMKIADFVEKEAELSESDWDSADEDEKDLDEMEFEQGDDEKFDENEIKKDLEKIHLRRMLDDDTKEVKILQELYLEDGEMHGTGRERQFKWRNIDDVENDENNEENEEESNEIEDKSEEQWRKLRYEREMFLREKFNEFEEESCDLLSDSQILKIGHKVVKNSQENNKVCKEKQVEHSKSLLILSNKKGSFLSRGEQVLQRVATFTKTNETVVQSKTSTNFLFQKITEEKTTIFNDKKRRLDGGTPNVIKKLKLSENLSLTNRPRGKTIVRGKLF